MIEHNFYIGFHYIGNKFFFFFFLLLAKVVESMEEMFAFNLQLCLESLVLGDENNKKFFVNL